MIKTETALAPQVTSILSRPRSTSCFGNNNVWCALKEFFGPNSFDTAALKGLSY